jgi:hypothetical protein
MPYDGPPPERILLTKANDARRVGDHRRADDYQNMHTYLEKCKTLWIALARRKHQLRAKIGIKYIDPEEFDSSLREYAAYRMSNMVGGLIFTGILVLIVSVTLSGIWWLVS